MNMFLWGLIGFLLLYEPIIGYWTYQRFKRQVSADPAYRIRYYQFVMVGLWLPTIVVFIAIAISNITLQDIRLTLPRLNIDILGAPISYVAIGITLIYSVLLLYYAIGYHVNDKLKNQMVEMKQKQLGQITFSEILPITQQEKVVWNQLSWTAGITEEILYRGLLLFAITELFPQLSIWFVLLLSSFLFGMAHTYQGVTGVLRTTAIGFLFGMLVLIVDSIFPLILVHALIDYVGKLGDVNEANK